VWDDFPYAPLANVANELGVSRWKVKRLIRDKHLDARLFGGRLVVTKKSIAAYKADLPRADIRPAYRDAQREQRQQERDQRKQRAQIKSV
jgi:hypothetical protein